MSPPVKRWLGRLALAAAALVYSAPLLFMLASSLEPDDLVLSAGASLSSLLPQDPSFDNYGDVFERVAFGRLMLNSLVITAGIVVGGLLINAPAGYALARTEWRGRRLALGLVLALLILPFEAFAVPLYYQVTFLGWRNDYLVQILPFLANAFSIYLFYTFFAGFPRELEEAARIDGAGTLRIFWSIALPSARPALATAALLTFLTYWGLYLWPLMVTTGPEVRPLPLGLAAFRGLPPLRWGDIMAFAVMMAAPVMLLFLAFQRWFVRGVSGSGLKG